MQSVQASFGGWDHDSLQFHFFCDGHVGAARLFRTPTLTHASLWLHDGTALETLHSSSNPLKSKSDHLDVSDGDLAFRESNGIVRISHRGKDIIELEPQTTLRWNDTISTVVHQVRMHGRLLIDGQWKEGIGYCKRYSWTPAPHHWGYRFIQGFTDSGDSLWTAEATFGYQKYDYFKLMNSAHEVTEADPNTSTHRQDSAHARINGIPVSAELEERAAWETPLVSSAMDSLLRQRVCRLTLHYGDRSAAGWAINETCYGTLG